MLARIWGLAARLPVPNWLSLSYPARVFERVLTDNYGLQRTALSLVPEGTRVLMDVGCGGAAYLKWCEVPQKVGVDVSPKRLKIARRFCETIEADVRDGLPDIGADVVLCLEVLEHLDKRDGSRLLGELCRHRYVILSTPREFFRVSRDSYEAHRSHWPMEDLEGFGFSKVADFAVPPSSIYVRGMECGEVDVEELIAWPLVRRLVKFGLAGGSGYGVHLVVLAGLTSGLGVMYLWSAIVASVVNITWNFAWNERWTFSDRHRGSLLRRYAKYFATTAGTGLIYFGLLWLFTDVLGLFYLVSAVVSLGLAAVINFAVSMKWVWKGGE